MDKMVRKRSPHSNSIGLTVFRSKRPKEKSSSQTMALLFLKAFRPCTLPPKWSVAPSCGQSPPAHFSRSQLVDLSAAQDVEAGDGTTSVVVLAGSLLGAAEKMLEKGIHPTVVAESFLRASAKAVEYLEEISTPVDLNDRGSLLRAASTSLNSKARIS